MRHRRTLLVIGGAVGICALAAGPLGDQGFPLIVLLGPPATGAAATLLGRSWRPAALCWALSGLLMLVVDWIVNGEDQVFHLVLAALMAALTGLGAGLARLGRRATAVGAVLALATLAAAGDARDARASSLAYVRDGNVWLANPDGGGARQVTSGGGYASPSQADDGTIVALHGGSELVRMDRQGRSLPGPGVPPTPAGSGPLDPRISPDGSKVAFHWITYACDFCGGNLRTGTQVTWADRPTPAAEFGYQRPDAHPSWLSNSRLLLFGVGADVVELGTGADAVQAWFQDSEYIPRPDEDIYYEGEATRAGDKLALGGGVTAANKPSARIRFFSANGPYPAKPTARCNLNDPTDAFQDLTWSPDGGALAFADAEGIWVMPVNLADCSSLRPALAVPGGQDPDWGPADVGSGPGAESPPPGPTSGGSGPGAGAPLRLTGLAVVPRSFRARRAAHIRFRLSAAATVTLRLRRAGRGRGPRGTLTRHGGRGVNRVRFRARVGGRRLAPGRYRLTAVARAGARRSAPARTTFRVLR